MNCEREEVIYLLEYDECLALENPILKFTLGPNQTTLAPFNTAPYIFL